MPDEADFIRTIKENEGIIFRITTVYCADRIDRQDLYQDIVYQLWKSFDSFNKTAKLSTWLYRVALNTAITHLHKAKRLGGIVALDDFMLNLADESSQFTQERTIEMYSKIRNLGPVEKSIVLLYLEGKTYAEIADITGFTVTNTATRLSRIREKLKNQLNNK
ncbi:MAG: sigma-70 family RNA polymerase sigma factor [Sediminibacterium sp.]